MAYSAEVYEYIKARYMHELLYKEGRKRGEWW